MPNGDAWTWHLRPGHKNIRDIQNAVRLNLISGILLALSNTKVETLSFYGATTFHTEVR